MGYLLPIQYTQYQEYQNRIRRVNSNYSRTVKVDKVKRTYLLQLENKSRLSRINPSKQTEKSTDKLYADLTGIGGNFDERI